MGLVLTPKHIRQRFQDAENAGDADAIGALLGDDAVLMVPDYPVQEGKPACVEFLRELFAWQREHLERQITYSSSEVLLAGEFAFDRGLFSFTIAPREGGDSARVTGKYLWILRRAAGGDWKVARLIASRDETE